ncbi:MAG: magnesium transporter CorA family protein [Myxococcota bacterium]
MIRSPENTSSPPAPATVAATAVPPAPPWVARLDFTTKTERLSSLEEVRTSRGEGVYYWVDIDALHPEAREAFRGLDINDTVITEALGLDVDGRHDVYDDCLHVAVTSGTLEGERLARSHVDIIIAGHVMVTVRRGPVEFLEQVRRRYRQDFVKFARSPSFLLYECFDTLIQSYRRTIQRMGVQVEKVQSRIFGEVDDGIFTEVSELTQDHLVLRKIMLAVREVMHELATRRSPFVSETAQPFLDRMVDSVDRLASDLGVGREILSETLNLYMGIVSYRTNSIVKRLTVVSVIFMPLTFLCGVYGMNFDTNTMMPELTWPYGYRAFWVAVVVITASLLLYMRRKRWI